MKKSLLVLTATFALVAIVFVVDRLSAGDRGSHSSAAPSASIHAAGAVLSGTSIAVPVQQPPAPNAESRIQWEYNVVQSNAVILPAEQLNELGNDGWEMCGVRHRGQGAAYYYFKREKLTGGTAVAVSGDNVQYFPPPQLTLPPPTMVPTIVRPETTNVPSASTNYAPTPPAYVPTPAVQPPSAPSFEPNNDEEARPIGSTGELPPSVEVKPRSKAPKTGGRSY